MKDSKYNFRKDYCVGFSPSSVRNVENGRNIFSQHSVRPQYIQLLEIQVLWARCHNKGTIIQSQKSLHICLTG
jgi:hypothetical protein